jgi:alkylation response protein AidB-like acyl-CoA dehydrogenase
LHQCQSTNHEVRQQGGSWSLRGRKIFISRWSDYAGVTGLEPRGERVVDLYVVIESNPPVIVIDDDQNIFYSREPQPARGKQP